ncbi:MAG: transporter substrate-binding domain-containing protein [Acetobacteraceae bacterium]|nr:transporter substrate-binding domain-containing protein [Acetobacteraceae bacterium]
MARTTAVAIGLALAVCGVAGRGIAAAPNEGAPLRVCADPDNLPFTGNAGARPGFYLELAEHLAEQLGRPLDVVWAATYAPKRMLRTTLLAGKCDMFFGVPSGSEGGGKNRMTVSAPVIEVGYALVTRVDSPLADLPALSGKRVAVQFGSPAQALMAKREDVDAVTVTSPEEGLQALEDGRADAALLWGPSAGYANASPKDSRYRVLPLAADGMRWNAAIAFAPGEDALRDKVDGALAQDGAVIRALAKRYGFPIADSAPVRTAAAEGGVGFGEDLQIPSVSKGAPLPPGARPMPQLPAGEGAGSASSSQNAAVADADTVHQGADLFNSTCAHCHGPDAVQAERRINLRLLHHRYGETMDQVFFVTVTNGRPDKGMPNWTGVFTDDQFKSILAFLHSVQEEQ